MVSCRDCHWASTSAADAPPSDWTCHAPDVVALLDLGNTFTPCRFAREFRNVCGADGRHFTPRSGEINDCLRQDAA